MAQKAKLRPRGHGPSAQAGIGLGLVGPKPIPAEA